MWRLCSLRALRACSVPVERGNSFSLFFFFLAAAEGLNSDHCYCCCRCYFPVAISVPATEEAGNSPALQKKKKG